MIWVIPVFVAFCVFIAVAPRELVKTLLAGVWALMALGAVASTLYACASML